MFVGRSVVTLCRNHAVNYQKNIQSRVLFPEVFSLITLQTLHLDLKIICGRDETLLLGFFWCFMQLQQGSVWFYSIKEREISLVRYLESCHLPPKQSRCIIGPISKKQLCGCEGFYVTFWPLFSMNTGLNIFPALLQESLPFILFAPPNYSCGMCAHSARLALSESLKKKNITATMTWLQHW